MRLLLALGILSVLPLRAASETQSEYKQADSSFYLRGDVFAVDPSAAILAPSAATNIGGSYLVSTRGRAPQFVYLEDTHDWIEPITPPSEPASLNISPTEMQVREAQGSVQVALSSAPTDFHEVERGMKLPDGAMLRTGDNGSVAVLFGGVDSVRLAPNTQAAVQMNLQGGKRDVEIDVRKGMVFSKVGSRAGEKQAYAIHTPFGDATAHGTDYVTVVYPQRVDVWVAQGTVQLTSSAGLKQTTSSDGKSPLKVMRNPEAEDAASAMTESAESLTALLNFIPLANQKLKALAERTQSGAHLTATEKDYVGRIRKVGSLIKLAVVNARSVPLAAPTPLPAPIPVATTPPESKPPLRALPVETGSITSSNRNAVPLARPAPHPAVAKTSPAAKALTYQTKPVVIVLPPAHFPKAAPDADETVPAKPAQNSVKETTDVAKTAAPNKPAFSTKGKAPATVAAAAKFKSATASHFLRAKSVDAAELAEMPAVKSAPPVPRKSSAEIDPNSLGAPLQPMRPILTTRLPEPTASHGLSASAKPAASYTVP